MRITICNCNTEKPMVRITTENADYIFDIGKDNLQSDSVHGFSPWGAGEIEEISYDNETNRVRIKSLVHNPKDEKRTLITKFNESRFVQQIIEYKPASETVAFLNQSENDDNLPY